MPEPSHLVRAIGRWSLAALMLNTMIGASIFGLPSLLAARLGESSVTAYIVAAGGVGIIAACLAEVASQFQEAGGPYLYARVAFGRFAAIQIGWLTWLSRIAASSAVADLFISYLGQFFPGVEAPLMRALVLIVLLAFLAAVNYRGVKSGTWLNNFFTLTKLTLLVCFIIAGLMALALHPAIRVSPSAVPATASHWFEAILLIVYAYAGFEAALFVSGETRDTRKNAPVALLIAMVTATLLYVAVQYVVMHTLSSAALSSKPAADAARHFLGPAGAGLVAAGTLVSVYGYLSANMLHTPRLTFAMGERGDFPAFFAAVHPRFRTPHVSIVVFALLLIAFSIAGNFRWNAVLAAVFRLFVYGAIAAALPVLRRRQALADAFRLPAGTLFAVLGLAFTAALAFTMHFAELAVMAATFFIAFLNWVWLRRSTHASEVKSIGTIAGGD